MQDEMKKKKKKQEEGRGWHGDPEGHAEAGRKGGETTAEEYGSEFYQEIGSLGGRVSPGNFKNDPDRASQAGKKGGQRSHGKSDEDEYEE